MKTLDVNFLSQCVSGTKGPLFFWQNATFCRLLVVIGRIFLLSWLSILLNILIVRLHISVRKFFCFSFHLRIQASFLVLTCMALHNFLVLWIKFHLIPDSHIIPFSSSSPSPSDLIQVHFFVLAARHSHSCLIFALSAPRKRREKIFPDKENARERDEGISPHRHHARHNS